VKAVVGAEAIKELKKPLLETELQNSLLAAAKRAEQRFSAEHPDREIGDLVRQMPLAVLPSIREAIRGFYDAPAAPATADALGDQLAAVAPKDLESERIASAVASYMEFLREELVSVDALREKLNALADIETARNTARTLEELGEIKKLVAEFVARDATARPIALTRPKADVESTLHDCVERGRSLANDLRKSPPSTRAELFVKSDFWHTWRQSCEQAMRESFSSPQPLLWLKDLVPRHLDFQQPWKDRVEHLLDDIDNELEYLETLARRLDKYEKAPYSKEPPYTA
jgi:hypothetical protein